MQVKSNDEPLSAARWPLNDVFSRIVRERRSSGNRIRSTPLGGRHFGMPKLNMAIKIPGAMTLESLNDSITTQVPCLGR